MADGTAMIPPEGTEYLEELAPGQTLLHGQYRIERYLNSGGFGITYLARDSLDRRVVIKECFPSAFCHRSRATVRARSRAHQGEFRSIVNLFLREARNLSKLRHSNIVGVHQVFEDNETAYMALDLVDGRDLLDIIEDGGAELSPGVVQGILLRLLDAVAFMHGQDILHRDISPDNILLNTAGEPVLIDFGSAREEATKASRVLTSLLVVKDGYSPQEFYIANSKQMPCSDLYALAATFYHIVTGAAPPNSQSRLAAIATGDPDPYRPVTGRYPAYGPAFLASIDKAMNVFPGDRIQTAEEWLGLIDPARQLAAAVAAVERTQSIESTVTQLISQMRAAPDYADPVPPRAKVAPPPEPPKPRVIEYIGFDDDDDLPDGSTTEPDLLATGRPEPLSVMDAPQMTGPRMTPARRSRGLRLGCRALLIGAAIGLLVPSGQEGVATTIAQDIAAPVP